MSFVYRWVFAFIYDPEKSISVFQRVIPNEDFSLLYHPNIIPKPFQDDEYSSSKVFFLLLLLRVLCSIIIVYIILTGQYVRWSSFSRLCSRNSQVYNASIVRGGGRVSFDWNKKRRTYFSRLRAHSVLNIAKQINREFFFLSVQTNRVDLFTAVAAFLATHPFVSWKPAVLLYRDDARVLRIKN